MNYLPPPPGMSKEEMDKYQKDTDRYYSVMLVLMTIAGILFIVLCGLIAYAKFYR